MTMQLLIAAVPMRESYQFFSNTTAIKKTKNLIKYIVSRWGFATNLHAWELWNEVNQIRTFNSSLLPPKSYDFYIINWHQDMYNYINQIDPFKHLITTSYAGGIDNTNIPVFNIVDFSQTHDYKDPITNTNDDFQNHFYAVAEAASQLNKPYMNGEWGVIDTVNPYLWKDNDPNGFELHNSLWSSSFSTSMGAVSNWFWNNDYIKGLNLFHMYGSMASFMNNLPIPSSSFSPQKITNINGIRSYYMANTNTDTIYGWLQDINFHFQNLRLTPDGTTYLMTLNPIYKPTPNTSNNEITLPVSINQNNKSFIVEWYSAETGLIYQTASVISANNTIILNMPISLRTSAFGDAVFKVYLDCNQFIWREGILSNTYQNVASDLASAPNDGSVFYRTADNKLNSIWWNPTIENWERSELNNAANNVAGDIAPAPNGSVFYRTIDNKINSIWWNPVINNWERSELNNSANNVAGDIISAPYNGCAFYRTTDNKLNSIWWNPTINNWQWSGLNNAANNVSGDVVSAPYDGCAFYRTTDNKLNSIWWNPAINNWQWSGLNNAANNVAGGVVSASYGNVFYRTTDNKINSIWWNPAINNWEWSELNNAANNVPSGNLTPDNLGNVFFRGSDNIIHRIFYKSQCYYIPSEEFHKYGLFSNSEEQLLPNEFNIYPNPTNGAFNVELEYIDGLTTIEVFNAMGSIVLEKNITSRNLVRLDIQNQPNGIYFVKIISSNNINVKKIIKN